MIVPYFCSALAANEHVLTPALVTVLLEPTNGRLGQ
jgi:hypothetical protein